MARTDWNRPEVEPVAEGYRRIKLTISYDGSLFHGWQEQNNAHSVQQTIADLLKRVTKEDTVLLGSGRTDAGVHALGQVAHFDTKSQLDAEKFATILNSQLDKSIRIISSEDAPAGFHARYTTMAREYWYYIKRMDEMLAFDDKRYAFYKRLPSLETLNGYASILFGTHDFTTFASSRDLCPSKWRDIYVSEWEEVTDQYGCKALRYKVCGNAFLYHQVRSMVGTMVECGLLGYTDEQFKAILDSKDRSKALRTAPADGLYLARISYDENEYMWFEEQYGR